jgi:hypothetical protein
MTYLKKFLECIQVVFFVFLFVGILAIPFMYLDANLPNYTVGLYVCVTNALACVMGIVYGFYKVFMRTEDTLTTNEE